MKTAKFWLVAVAMMAGATASSSALARGWHHGGHARVGVFIGAPLFYSPWYYPAYPAPYYYPPVAYPAYPSGPTTYVEQAQPEAAPAPRPDNYWYYCPEAKAYYPYVKQCAGGWQKVSPQPPAS